MMWREIVRCEKHWYKILLNLTAYKLVSKGLEKKLLPWDYRNISGIWQTL